MEKKELDVILALHLKWLEAKPGGKRANLSGANLRSADLRIANLSGANLSGADLRSADLRIAKNINEAIGLFFPIACPETGSFTAYKKAERAEGDTSVIVQLLIPASAKRTSAPGRKCRADKAKVVAIWNTDRTKSDLTEAVSSHDNEFIYKVGDYVAPKEPFCEDRWNECSSGIHFFVTFDEAVNY